jgi:prephenate dehydratase
MKIRPTAYVGIITLASCLSFSVAAETTSPVYVQASEGSFNNAAINQLYTNSDQQRPDYVFSGTPLQTFVAAETHSAFAFTALENSTIKGNLVQATLKAIQEYKVIEVKAAIRTPIEMCLLRSKTDISAKKTLIQIASHPAALKQIDNWKSQYSTLDELSIPKGTAEAARMVATGELPSGTGAIGACMLEDLYPQLVVTEKSIQDNKDNRALFALMKLTKRDTPISQKQADQELREVIHKSTKLEN